MASRVFVTGASGRIGLRLVRALAERGDAVVGLARSEDKARKVREAGAADCAVADLHDVDALARALEGAERVFHLAGALRGPGRETPDRVNRQGTARLLDALERAGAEPRRIVFTSSWLVYGDRSDLWVDETFDPAPNTRYGRSKAEAEKLLLGSGRPVVVARLGNVYGPDFPILFVEAIRRGRLWLPGEGNDLHPWIHVDDAVAALLALDERAQDGEVYCVAGRDQPKMREFYGEVARLVGGKPPRFWSTYVPSYVQLFLARQWERLASHVPGYTPHLTPDLLKIFTASLRLRVERLEKEIAFEWRYPDHRSGLAAVLGG